MKEQKKIELIKNYAYAVLKKEGNIRMYFVQEPKLNNEEKKILEKLERGFIQLIDLSPTEIEERRLYFWLEDKVKFLLKEMNISITPTQYNKILYYLFRNFLGLNEIEPLMHDPFIEDINCNGVGCPIYIRHKKYGNMKTNIKFNTEEELKNFIIKLAQRCNKYITYSNPFLEGTLPSGDRVEANFASDVSTRGPAFSIRKFGTIPYSPIDLMNFGTVDAKTLAYLWYLIEQGRNILIVGGAAAGKTTFLNAISVFIPPYAKIVSIEDTREIRLYHENWLPNVARPAIGGLKIGEVDLFTLLKESFRFNPDYVIVGEVRGRETYVMFQGMAAGHPTLSTMHAEDIKSLINRLITKPIDLSSALVELLDVVISLVKFKRKGEIIRRVRRIDEVKYIDEKTRSAETNLVMEWKPNDKFEFNESWLLRKLADEIDEDVKNLEKEIEKRAKFLNSLKKRGITSLSEVYEEIKKYYFGK